LHAHRFLRRMSFYHAGSRALQDEHDSRRIADKLVEVTLHEELTDEDRTLIHGSRMFFLATADAEGQPDVSFKGGEPGFVRAIDARTLAFPHYDGNGMFRSLGNARVNPRVALLFVDFADPDRLRILGEATVSERDPLLGSWPGAQLVVRVRITSIFPNCPRYIPKMQLVEASRYVPRAGEVAPTPAWKEMDEFKEDLPRRGR
jgi:predicted pyridoxine 5'-phosphate oxidase superfamily flavin-nucleotide-binding protein